MPAHNMRDMVEAESFIRVLTLKLKTLILSRMEYVKTLSPKEQNDNPTSDLDTSDLAANVEDLYQSAAQITFNFCHLFDFKYLPIEVAPAALYFAFERSSLQYKTDIQAVIDGSVFFVALKEALLLQSHVNRAYFDKLTSALRSAEENALYHPYLFLVRDAKLHRQVQRCTVAHQPNFTSICTKLAVDQCPDEAKLKPEDSFGTITLNEFICNVHKQVENTLLLLTNPEDEVERREQLADKITYLFNAPSQVSQILKYVMECMASEGICYDLLAFASFIAICQRVHEKNCEVLIFDPTVGTAFHFLAGKYSICEINSCLRLIQQKGCIDSLPEFLESALEDAAKMDESSISTRLNETAGREFLRCQAVSIAWEELNLAHYKAWNVVPEAYTHKNCDGRIDADVPARSDCVQIIAGEIKCT